MLTTVGLEPSSNTRALPTKPGYLPMPRQLPLLPLTLLRMSSFFEPSTILISSRRVWDTHSGEEMYAIQHNHIVRAIAFPPNSSSVLATGGNEKKLRIFNFDRVAPPPSTNGSTDAIIKAESGIEIGPGVHQGTIKSIVWTQDPTILVTAADDKIIRWWNLGTQSVFKELVVQGEVGSCEFTNVKGEINDIGGGLPVLTIAAGRTVYFFGGPDATQLLKSVVLPYDVASVALHPSQRKFITGGIKDTWAKVYDYDSEKEIGTPPLPFPLLSLIIN
jgi:serine-threonine kinase receptor-associated protein